MTHQAKRAEKLAEALLNEYLDECLTGRGPEKNAYLDRCPEQEKDSLWEALQGVDYYINCFYTSYVRPAVLDNLVARLEAIRRQKVWMKEARERAEQIWELGVDVSLSAIAERMNIDTSRLQPQDAGRDAAVSSTRAFHRNETASPATRQPVASKADRYARERTLAARAQEVLDQFDLSDEPVDLDELARGLNLYVQDVSMAGSEGCLLTDGEVGTILINRNIASDARRRFTLAHEIAHFILHRHKPIFEDSKNTLAFSASSQTEIDANVFAAMLLMPRSLLPPRFSAEKPSLAQADILAKRFGVSLQAALRRIVGESSWRCAMVVSRDNAVWWSAASPWFNGYIGGGTSPHQHTIARTLLELDYSTEDATIMPAELWVQGALAEEEAKVREESRRTSAGYVYSLITVIDPD